MKIICRINTLFLMLLASSITRAEPYYEISGSAFATDNAPMPQHIRGIGEKMIVVDPREHFFGAYNASGKLIRWGLATAGKDYCRDSNEACRTRTGNYRIYSLGSENCTSKKYPQPFGGAPMPYCMFFASGQAIHGSDEVAFDNESHGCIRVHVSDAKWLRYEFVEAPSSKNHFRGTVVKIKPY